MALKKYVMVGGYRSHEVITWDETISSMNLPVPEQPRAVYHPPDADHQMRTYGIEVYTKRKISFPDGTLEFFAIKALDDHAAVNELLNFYGGQRGKTEK